MLVSKVKPWSNNFDNQFVLMEMECNLSIAFTIWIYAVYRDNSHETLKKVLSQGEQIEIMEIVNCVDSLEIPVIFNYRDYPHLYHRFLSTLDN